MRPKGPALNTGPSAAARQLPFLRDGRRDIADRLGVEAVDEQHRRANQQHPDLEGADRLAVDKVGNVDRAGCGPRLRCCDSHVPPPREPLHYYYLHKISYSEIIISASRCHPPAFCGPRERG